MLEMFDGPFEIPDFSPKLDGTLIELLRQSIIFSDF